MCLRIVIPAISLFTIHTAAAQPAPTAPSVQPTAESTAELEARSKNLDDHALSFDADISVEHSMSDALISGTTRDHIPRMTARRHWYVYVGQDARRRLEPTEFYRVVERDDLARRYERRHTAGVGLTAGGAGAALLGGFLLYGSEGRPGLQAGGLATAAGGIIALCFGAYYLRNPHPVSEDTARELAADYNAGLKARLHRTPQATRARITPYVDGAGGGLALGGTF